MTDQDTPLQRVVDEIACQIRHYHFDGDGCVDPELPLLQLAGAILLKPDVVPMGIDGTYAEICAHLGVNARSIRSPRFRPRWCPIT